MLKKFYHSALGQFYQKCTYGLERFLFPVVLLGIRLIMAKIFWYSGIAKISDWPVTLALFQQEYHVPYLSPELAAYLAALIELTCPILLTLGFASRLATLPMIAMTTVIYFTYDSSNEPLFWFLLLAVILCAGSGKLSLDYLFKRAASMQ